MKQDDFDQLTTAIDALSPSQRLQLLERLQHPETIPAIVTHLEQHLQSHHCCPKCSHDQIHRWGTLRGLQHYRCHGGHKTFTALTDTPLASPPFYLIGQQNYQQVTSFKALPISAKERTVLTPASSNAANFSSAVPLHNGTGVAPTTSLRMPWLSTCLRQCAYKLLQRP